MAEHELPKLDTRVRFPSPAPILKSLYRLYLFVINIAKTTYIILLGVFMKIFIYGDSNTWGQMPDVNGYNSNAIPLKYPQRFIWWNKLVQDNEVFVNGLCGRAINNNHPTLEGRNATQTISKDIEKHTDSDLVILQLGTNDCKTIYNNSAEKITQNLDNLTNIIQSKTDAQIMILSPAQIRMGNAITNKYYIDADQKCQQLDTLFKDLADKKDYIFVSCLKAKVDDDGEHLAGCGHKFVAKHVIEAIDSLQNEQQNGLCLKR